MSHDNALPTWYIVETKAINYVKSYASFQKLYLCPNVLQRHTRNHRKYATC